MIRSRLTRLAFLAMFITGFAATVVGCRAEGEIGDAMAPDQSVIEHA